MQRMRVDSGWRIAGLGAKGPAGPLAPKLRLFGQFVGDWEIFGRPAEGAPSSESPGGEVHVGWVLGGTAIQDVWGPLDPATGRLVPQGTTLRYYDASIDAWRSTGFSAYQRAMRRFIGHPVDGEIVLKEQGRGWRGERWIFSDVTRDRFRWRAESPRTSRGPRRITEDYSIRRKRR